MLTWYDARDEACCPLRLPRTGYKARQGNGLCTSMGRSRRQDSTTGAAVYGLDTDWTRCSTLDCGEGAGG